MNYQTLLKTFLFTLVLGFPLGLTAQQFSFINYSLEEGLIQSQVEVIIQDRDGFLWVGTVGGVSRFDGKTFTNYSMEDGLLDNHVNSIWEDRNGHIWMGFKGGISKFNGNTFQSFRFKHEFAKASVQSIAEDDKGNLWLGTVVDRSIKS